MSCDETFTEFLTRRGVSRRSFLAFCATTASALALPAEAARQLAANLATARRPSVIWLSFQECTGCTESLTRSGAPTVEALILDHLSLDYHHTLQAASGAAAEQARRNAMAANYGSYVLVVDGSIPTADGGVWSTIAGVTNLEMLRETMEGAALVIAVGTCAAYGGIPAAAAVTAPRLNQSGARSVGDLMDAGAIPSLPLVNVPGCPPVPDVISGTIAYFLANGSLPELDDQNRPRAYYGKTVHERCPRLSHYRNGEFAFAFDDEGAQKGYCLYLLGCKGPETHNACPKVRWNLNTSFPMHSGHGCLGCSEAAFWDRAMAVDGSGFTGSCFYPDIRP
ncbi:hydrogenase small subunit [Thiorhodococcus mannitoliphagus]|uniref:hydrogenase (acceptor) n=1 Tax=Thiorhodococcus mannitoliphagus TaxID=329406 RepID=A0A6P1DWA4_9GAMM|nr:hydrogenase small subunit [Thiorhodococcus mannitoliphagus]NEX20986.1 hydrogenase small subunit [Thiorhodococcus mannitoliphagus]